MVSEARNEPSKTADTSESRASPLSVGYLVPLVVSLLVPRHSTHLRNGPPNEVRRDGT